MLSMISFVIGFIILKKIKKSNEIALLASIGLIFTWFILVFLQFLTPIVSMLRPDVKDIIGFTVPLYQSIPYLHLMLLIGVLGVLLFYKSYSEMIVEIKSLFQYINEYFQMEYKISLVFSVICFVIIFLLTTILTYPAALILILIFSSTISFIITSILMFVAINKGWKNLDKTKLNLRRNSIAFAGFIIVLMATLIDLFYFFFFSYVPSGESFFWNFRDLLTNTLFTGMIYLEISLGITLVYKILKFANFAHAELVTFGGYIAFIIGAIGDSIGSWNSFGFLGIFQWIPMFLIVATISFIVTALLAYVLDELLYKPLRKRNASPVTLMIASFALGLSLRAVYYQIFTDNPIIVSTYLISIHLDTIILRIVIIASVLFTTLAFQIILYNTKYGKIMRAVSDNEDLAKISGIKIPRIHLLVWIIAGGFAGVAGLLYTVYDFSPRVYPEVGFTLLLSAFAVAILGGIGSFEGVVIASLIVGFAENFGVYVLNQLKVLHLTFQIPALASQGGIPYLTNFVATISFSSSYKVAISYIILIIFLTIRPYGLLGEKPSGDR